MLITLVTLAQKIKVIKPKKQIIENNAILGSIFKCNQFSKYRLSKYCNIYIIILIINEQRQIFNIFIVNFWGHVQKLRFFKP